jgi:protoheme IX farnesyltransferase
MPEAQSTEILNDSPAALAGQVLARPIAQPVRVDSRSGFEKLLADYAQLSKLRLNAMVVLTTAVGFIAASRGGFKGIEWLNLLGTSIGVMLAAMGASAFNQAIESKNDARMNRTRNRPVAAGRMSRAHACMFGMWCSVIGVAILCPSSNGLAAILTAGNIALYALIYTPLKRFSTTNTLVGAVVGAIPPVIGWAAAAGTISQGAIVLGLLLFAWQIPHFLALAWMYRQDYEKGGYKMLPGADPAGGRTARMVVLYSLALVFIGLATARTGVTSYIFLVASAFLGVCLTYCAFHFAMKRTDESAKKLFLFSVLYLPVLLLVMLADVQNPLRPKLVDTGAVVLREADFSTPAQADAVMNQANKAAENFKTANPKSAEQFHLPAPRK